MVEDDCVSNIIPLPNKHSEDDISKDMLMDFDKAFVNVHHSILHALILVANFLNDKEILDMMCQELSIGLKGKYQK
ncbi:hypothetical protein H5410_007884 [Solanum commersonii]|uniref:Uncharacterized protein n=1 Tax=Solanum commersonii TaxID=4109 RepID=A0A9J6AEW9_SOLCO|nr:hypothetical protein H5410_007884 [Solanum commersonii]